MLIPNTERIIVKRLKLPEASSAIILTESGRVTAGENLFYGEVVHPGTTKFKKGQRVYYSEFSAAQMFDLGGVFKGEESRTDAMHKDRALYVVPADDVLAYDDYDFSQISKNTKTDKS